MKKLLFLLVFFTSISANSQVLISILLGDKLNSEDLEFGLETGINFSSINGLETNDVLGLVNIGFYFDIKVERNWWFYTGVLVKSTTGAGDLTTNDLNFLNATIYEEEGVYQQRIRYFQVPALLKYRFDNKLYVEAGPQFSLRAKAWIQFDAEQDNIEISRKEYNKDDINPLDAGLMAGFGYRFKKTKGLSIGVKYYYGLSNVYKGKSGTNANTIYAKVNIPIGANAEKNAAKKAKREQKKKEKQARKQQRKAEKEKKN